VNRIQREHGAEHPGWRWGIFTLRVPFYHMRVEWPELSQGIFVAGATGLALVPVLTNYFGLTFEEAVGCIFMQAVPLSSAPILFGEPYSPGWITPALPLALTFVLAVGPDGAPIYPAPEDKFHIMTAVSLDFALLVFLLGVTGLGRVFVRWIPPALKGGIVLGAAIAALKRVFIDDPDLLFYPEPITTLTAVGICLLLTFSLPIQALKARFRPVAIIASLGLLPGFLAAAAVGPLVGEISYDVEWGILIAPFGDLYEKVSPFSIGWPPWRMYIEGLPLALMGYVILFGDIVTGEAVLNEARPNRPDEKIRYDESRTHLSLAIRNAIMALFAPFFPTQGCLWTGVHVIVVKRWAEGRAAMDSIFSGIASYYVFGIPLLYFVQPLLTGLRPLMGIALSLTLVLTGFACAYVAMGIARHQIERGVVVLTAVTLTLFADRPYIGIIVGIVATVLLVGVQRPAPVAEAET